MTLYFAYGSNLDAEDWTAFCTLRDFPCVRLEPVSPALLLDAELVFDRHSRSRQGGVLNLRERPGQAAEGMLFRSDNAALRALDMKEGAPRHYARVRRHAVLPDGTVVEAMTYVGPSQGFHPPHADYLAVVRRGRIAHGLAPGMMEEAARDTPLALTIHHLFVYGTLMTGEANARHLAGVPRQAGSVRGVLHDCGPYPALALGEGETHGEVVELPLERLAGMDALEDVAPAGAPGGLYRRSVLPVRTAEAVLRAYVYVMDDPSRFPRIPGGDWRGVGDRHAAWANYAAHTPRSER
jgi:gamma-glutamylcyclotransferase (GGCT)/AIG2-like uncharacterized protein YtfP